MTDRKCRCGCKESDHLIPPDSDRHCINCWCEGFQLELPYLPDCVSCVGVHTCNRTAS